MPVAVLKYRRVPSLTMLPGSPWPVLKIVGSVQTPSVQAPPGSQTFSQAPQFIFGNVGRVISLRGPGQVSFDASLFKTFSLKENIKGQFRAEALNIANTPMFYGPNTTFTNPLFGQITSQANYPRLIQIGVRFYR